MKKTLFLSLLAGLLLPVFLSAQMDARQAYISTYKQIAMDEMERVAIPASIKMAQAILESGSGTSTLALQAKNHFGIKCGNKWSGKTMYRKDDDYDDKGKLIPSCFRKYESVASSFRAHSQFLLDNRRYAFLFELEPTDYRGWARGLKKAGYATSTTYANKLISIIEEYELYLFDLGIDPTIHDEVVAEAEPVDTKKPRSVTVSNKPSRKKPAVVANAFAVITINDVKNVSAKKGDTPEKIAERTNVDVKRLIRYNEFISRPNQDLEDGDRIYLQPKRASYRGKKKFHFVKDGERMFDIAQLYGLRLQKLYEKNRLDPGYEPAQGQKIKIRGAKVPVGEKPRKSWVGNNARVGAKDFEWENESEENQSLDTETYLQPMGPAKHNNSSPVEIIEEPVITAPQKPATSAVPKPRKVNNSNEIVWEKPTVVPQEKKEAMIEASLESIVEQPKSKVTPVPKPVITKVTPRIHMVTSGETLYRISKYYGISVAALKANNDLSDNTISVGQRLVVN